MPGHVLRWLRTERCLPRRWRPHRPRPCFRASPHRPRCTVVRCRTPVVFLVIDDWFVCRPSRVVVANSGERSCRGPRAHRIVRPRVRATDRLDPIPTIATDMTHGWGGTRCSPTSAPLRPESPGSGSWSRTYARSKRSHRRPESQAYTPVAPSARFPDCGTRHRSEWS
jgi:hypothetical protein